MSISEHKKCVADELAKAGVKDAQITLAIETNGTLLELLSCYQLNDNHQQTIQHIYEKAACDHIRNQDL